MPDLQCKTRGKSSPQGKSRVYFSCHPDDFERCFDMISEDILEKQNCAIWYDKDKEQQWDEQLESDLKGMRLFVIAITSQLLATKNRTLQYEFPFAIENHIPVLPVLMEPVLEKKFNQIFGNIQWLNPLEEDATAIPYKEKLDKMLSSVLLGDELMQRIRKEFDGYIFFSYRKKDRKYAYDVMRKIHDSKLCRDIAIWYDEYLVPGENFDESIKEALRKSDMFALMVTPNLVNEDNYVMEEEFPEAMRESKEVIPIEVEETDRDILSEKYIGIPEVIAYEDAKTLENVLISIIKKKDIKQHRNTPEHIYYMGLAYLAGVDMEVDQIRAVHLIKEAAEAGYLDAMKKLRDMYKNGEAVGRNFKIAAAWQRHIIEYYEKEYSQSNDKSLGLWLIDEMRKLGHIYYAELSEYPLAKEILEAAVEIAKELEGELAIWSLASCYEDLATYSLKYEERKTYYEKAIEIAEVYSEADTEYDFDDILSKAYGGYTSVFMHEEEYQEALKYSLKALDLAKKGVKRSNSEEIRYQLCNEYLGVGFCFLQLENPSEARVYLMEGYELVEALVSEYEKPYILIQQNQYLIAISNLLEKEQNMEEATAYLKQAERLAKELMEKEDTPETIDQHMRAAMRLGEFYQRQGEWQEGKKWIKISLESMKLRLEYDDYDYQETKQMQEYYHKMEDCEARGDKDAAVWYFEQAAERILVIEITQERLELVFDAAKRAYSYGLEYLDVDDFAKANYYFDYAIRMEEKVIALERSEEHLVVLATMYKAVALAHWKYKSYKESREYYKKEVEYFREVYEKTEVNKYWQEYMVATLYAGKSSYEMAQLCEAAGAYTDAEAHYRAALCDFLDARADGDELGKVFDGLGLVLECLGKTEEAEGYFEEARRYFIAVGTGEYILTLEMTGELLQETWGKVVRLSRKLAEYDVKAKRYDAAIENLLFAEDKADCVARVSKKRSDYEIMAKVQYRIYEVMLEMGDEEKAEEYLHKYKELCARIHDEQ